jgi:hypothetical protein
MYSAVWYALPYLYFSRFSPCRDSFLDFWVSMMFLRSGSLELEAVSEDACGLLVDAPLAS